MRVLPGLLAIASMVVGFACTDDEGSDGGPSSAGRPPAGSGGQAAGQTGSGAPGSGGMSTAGSSTDGGAASAGETNAGGAMSSGGAACYGDAADWAEILSASVECENDSDCCVVVNDCLSEARVVHLDVFEQAENAWPYCDDECNDCVPPQVVVACVDGLCAGSFDEESDEEGVSHCGNEGPSDPTPAEVSFSCQ